MEFKNHDLIPDREYEGVLYERVPFRDKQGQPVEGLHSIRITLNNPKQLNSYTTEMIKGVIAAEEGAMKHYRSLIKLAESVDDYVTADLVTTVLADEEGHRRQFTGFLKEYQR